MRLADHRAVLDVLADAIVAAGEAGQILYANPAAERLLGWPPGGLVGRPLTSLMPPRMRSAHEAGFRRYLATHRARIMGVPVRVPALRADGVEIDVELTLSALPSDEGELVLASLRDLRDRVELERRLVAQQRLAAQHGVMAVFARADRLDGALADALAAIGRHLGWPLAAFWERDGDRLRLRASFCDPALDGEPLLTRSATIAFAEGEGLPGRAWQERRAVWLADLAAERGLPRASVAAALGLRSALAFPILVGDQLLGVAECFALVTQTVDEELLQTAQTMGAQIGQFIERIRAQELLRQSAARAEAARAEAEDAARRARFVAQAGAMLASSLDYQATLQALASLAVPAFADFCLVDLVDERGELARVAAAHAGPARLPIPEEVQRHRPPPVGSGQPASRVLRSGVAELLTDVDGESAALRAVDGRPAGLTPALDITSHLAVPLEPAFAVASERARSVSDEERPLLGVLSFGRLGAAPRYTRTDLETAEELARRAASAVESARLFADLTRTEETYRFLAESMPQIVWTARPDGQLDYVNRVLATYLGCSVERAIGAGWHEMIHPDDLAISVERWIRSVATGEPYQVEHRVRRHDGVYRWFLVRGLAMRDASGAVVRWFGTSTDIEDFKNAALQLQAAVELREEFISIASHELRTPLTSLQLQVSGARRVLDRGNGHDASGSLAKLTGKLSAIDRQVSRLGKLVDDLLDVSRATAGRLQLELGDVELTALVREVAARFAADLAGAGCALSLELGPPVVGRWDAARLDQVISNFLANAIKYGGGKPITIRTVAGDQRATLSVIDRGIGIEPADQDRIFERFGRAASAAHYGGLGLGLWIVRVLAAAMGGQVTVESTPGAGSTFRLELPLRAPEG